MAAAGKDFDLTVVGAAFCTRIGIDLKAARAKRRLFARRCLDWSERKPHLAGALGAAIAETAMSAGWVEQTTRRREVSITRAGVEAFEHHFGFALTME